jgi:hypothetical protein
MAATGSRKKEPGKIPALQAAVSLKRPILFLLPIR